MRFLLEHLAWACLALVALAVYSTAGPLFHLHKVSVEGDGGWALRPETVREGLRESGTMSLFFGNFAVLEEMVGSLPLIRDASVRKIYPHELVIEVSAREPVARSANGGLVDRNGEWYSGASSQVLPVFAVSRRFLPQAIALHSDMREMLQPLELGINQLRLDDKGWWLFLSNGWVLELGQNKLRDRLKRFVAAWPYFKNTLAESMHLRVDLRYPHGMVVAGLQDKETKDG